MKKILIAALIAIASVGAHAEVTATTLAKDLAVDRASFTEFLRTSNLGGSLKTVERRIVTDFYASKDKTCPEQKARHDQTLNEISEQAVSKVYEIIEKRPELTAEQALPLYGRWLSTYNDSVYGFFNVCIR